MAKRYWQEEIECASREQITQWQNERLVKTVKHVYDNVELYRKRMDEAGVKPEDIKSIDDLKKLPFTYKQDLRDEYPYGLFATPLKDVVRLHASSGTTGKQIVVGYTRNDLDIWDDIAARQLYAVGADENDFVHVSYGYGLFTGGFGLHGGATKIGATAIPVSSGNTDRQVTILQDFGSSVLCCTPSYAMYIAETLEKKGIDPKTLNLKAGIFGAEPWTEEMRRQIEEKLNIKAYDVYGLTEIMGPCVSYECEAQSGMHVNEDHFIIEIINPETGEPLPYGEKGEIVFTCITKECCPFIRYRTRDIGVVTNEKCSCGRTFVKMTKPQGRSDDMLIIRGVNVFPSQIETVLLKMGYSPNYKIFVDRVNNTDTLLVQVEMTEAIFSDTVTKIKEHEKALEAELRSLLGIGADVQLVAPNSIERSMGKAVRVVDKRKLIDVK
ncbi:MAG: phenylacetate--CoA ligase [Oscillospiraceae bacterium]|nr:phenylacetate--CoA ligase [Oscillospiraceae bacterium]